MKSFTLRLDDATWLKFKNYLNHQLNSDGKLGLSTQQWFIAQVQQALEKEGGEVSMTCPCCGEDLKWHDYYGKKQHAEHYYTYPQTWIEKTGDIYKCQNEECESETHNYYFYTDDRENLLEGYPR